MHSRYAHMPADEIVRRFASGLLALRLQHIALAVVLGAGGILAVNRLNLALYLVCLAAIILSFIAFLVRLGRAFAGLQDILWQDGDIRTYRAVLEALRLRWRRASSVNALELELAFCDYFDCRDDDALERLGRLSFSGRKNAQRLRVFNLCALIYHDRGDVARRDEVVAQIRRMAAAYRAGSKIERAASGLARELALRFEPPEQWGDDDARYLRGQLASADKNINRWGLRLNLAAYGMAHGDAARAREELEALGVEPLVPRYERMRSELLLHMGTEKI